ncbi:MAG TPA: hypothetical protein VID28_02200 [Methylomirabilota bacterium]
MGKRSWLSMSIALAMLSTGCATEREWATWRAHPTHYANGNHMAFSVTNMVGGAPLVTPEMVQAAKREGWWGRNMPSDAQLANVNGTWEGTWTGYGLQRAPRGGIITGTFQLNGGATGQGRLAVSDAQVAEGVPLALRENSSMGVPVQFSVSENEMWVNNAEPTRPFAAIFVVEGDRLVGSFLYTGSRVRVEMTRQR